MGPKTPAPALTARRALPQLLFTRESVRWAILCLVARFPRFLDFLVVLSGSCCFCALLLLAACHTVQ